MSSGYSCITLHHFQMMKKTLSAFSFFEVKYNWQAGGAGGNSLCLSTKIDKEPTHNNGHILLTFKNRTLFNDIKRIMWARFSLLISQPVNSFYLVFGETSSLNEHCCQVLIEPTNKINEYCTLLIYSCLIHTISRKHMVVKKHWRFPLKKTHYTLY